MQLEYGTPSVELFLKVDFRTETQKQNPGSFRAHNNL